MKRLSLVLVLWSLTFALGVRAQDTFTRNQLDEEQRLAQAHLRESRKEIDRSVARLNAGLPNTALLTIFRADEDLSNAENMLRYHPEHIEKLVRSLFYDERRVRAEIRAKYDEIDNAYAEIEKEFWVLVDEFDQVTGRSGAQSLRAMLKKLDEWRAIANDENATAEEREEAQQALRDHSMMVERGDAEQALEELSTSTGGGSAGRPSGGSSSSSASADARAATDALFSGPAISMSQPAAPWNDLADANEGQWYTGTMPGGEQVETRRMRECDVPGAPSDCRETYEVRYADGTVATFHDYDPVELPDGTILVRNDNQTTYPDGSYDLVTEERFFNPDTCELKIVRTTSRYNANGQLKGDKVVETSFYKDCMLDPREDRRAQINPAMQVAGGSLEVISPSGERRVYPLSGDEPTTERRGEYVGGKGMFLISESEYTLSYERDDYGAILGVRESVGRQRNWEFTIAQVPNSVVYSDDLTSMTAKFILKDGKGKSAFTVSGWQVKGPSGAVVAQGNGGAPMEVQTSTSGQFEFIVRGQTDWGSDFTITQMVNMNL